MSTENDELKYLTIDPRAYRFIREQSMQDIADAFVEVITNSIDAYRKTEDSIFKVNIYVKLFNEKIIEVIDQAIGINADDMEMAFLQVGKYTASETSRGYFSRGAKDVSALGDLTITGIRNGLLSQCFINNLGMGMMTKRDVPVTEEDREKYKITENGLNFVVLLKEGIQFDSTSLGRYGNLTNHFALRDIFSNQDNQIHSHISSPMGDMEFRHFYQYPTNSTKVIDMVYNVPGYDTTAHFVLFKTDYPIQDQYADVIANDKYIKFGVTVSTDHAIHGNGTLYSQIRYHPRISYIYGRIHCNHINTLMHQLDLAPDQYDVIKNPYSVIDPNRVGGLNISHPFIKALYQIPYERIIFVLEQMENEEYEENDVNFTQLNDIFNNLDIDSNELDLLLQDDNKQFIERVYEKIQVNADNNVINEDQDLEYSQNNIKIIHSDNSDENIYTRPKLQIKFTRKPLKYNYITFKTPSGYVIEISTESSLLKEIVSYDEETDKLVGLNTKTAKIHLNYIIREALARLMTQKYFVNQEATSAGGGTNADFIFNRFEYFANKIEKQVYGYVVNN